MQKLNQDFILEIFKASIQNKDFMTVMVANMKPEYLPDGAYENVFKEIKKQFVLQEIMPTIGSLKLQLRKDKDCIELLQDVKEMQDVDVDSVLFNFEDFVKNCMFIDVYNKSSELFNKGKEEQAYKTFSNGALDITNFSLKESQYTKLLQDFNKRQIERFKKNHNPTKIPSMIDELDRRSGGGFEPGQLIIYIAESKGGKSFALIHHGVTGLRVSYDVLHVQLEGTEAECTNRYDACWSGNLYTDVKKGEFTEKSLKAYKKIRESLNSELYIYAPVKYQSFNCDDLQTRIKDLKKKRPNLKLVVLDYLDLANPDNKEYSPSEERFRQQKTARRLKEIAMEEDVLIITATQSSVLSRELVNDPDFVIDREHLSEDKGKIRVVDMMISINRTKEEAKEKICRLHIVAAREMYAGDEPIYIKQNLSRSRFYDRKSTLIEFFEQEMA